MVNARMVEEFSAKEMLDGVAMPLAVLQAEAVSLAQQKGDVLYVQRLPETFNDGSQQGLGFGEAAGLFGEIRAISDPAE